MWREALVAKVQIQYDPFDVRYRPPGDLLERAFPTETFRQHPGRQTLHIRTRRGQLQPFGANAQSICENHSPLQGILQFPNVPWPTIA